MTQKLAEAVSAYMRESPSIGVSRAMEWAVSARIAIHLARSRRVRSWEEQEGVRVDAEYAQQGEDGKRKGDPSKWMTPDLVIHRRGQTGTDHNWLVCEIKMHTDEPRRYPHGHDRNKLMRCKLLFGYGLALWVSIPRLPGPGTRAVCAEVNELGQTSPICTLVQL